jgi:hypothetical protein
MDTKLASFIATGSDDTSRIGIAADDNCFIAIEWIIALFDCSIKGIHINMDDFTQQISHAILVFPEKIHFARNRPFGKWKGQLIGAKG